MRPVHVLAPGKTLCGIPIEYIEAKTFTTRRARTPWRIFSTTIPTRVTCKNCLRHLQLERRKKISLESLEV